jgi:predicted nucleotide-binding protein
VRKLAQDKFYFAVLVLTPDDLALKRAAVDQIARDNVLFEQGLFMGALSRRTCLWS